MAALSVLLLYIKIRNFIVTCLVLCDSSGRLRLFNTSVLYTSHYREGETNPDCLLDENGEVEDLGNREQSRERENETIEGNYWEPMVSTSIRG